MTALTNELWLRIRDGDARLMGMYRRHYSRRDVKRPRLTRQMIGPGESLALMTPDSRACFVWRLTRYRRDAQTGVECSIFRNEGTELSSTLIKHAVDRAWERWPGMRLFTFVEPVKLRRINDRHRRIRPPGYCFIMAGWILLEGETTRGLRTLELLPAPLL